MKTFFENLPEKEGDFVEPLMVHFIDYHHKHPNAQTPDGEQLLRRRLNYQNLYRELANLKTFLNWN